MRTIITRLGIAGVVLSLVTTIISAGVPEWIATIRATGTEGNGNAEASQAWKELSRTDAKNLPQVFAGMDGAHDLAANWLRSAIEVIVERCAKDGNQLPGPALTTYLKDTQHNPRARRLAFEILAQDNPAIVEQLIPDMVNDPSMELRYDAVQRLVQQGDQFVVQKDTAQATRVYQQAVGYARDAKQIKTLNAALKKLGVTVDLPKHFGFLMTWRVIGPFENTERKGFDTVFPPENEINLSAEYPGKGATAKWVEFTSKHDYGLIDINKVCGAIKEVTGYAYTEYQSATARKAELRLGCKNAWKVWFNGQLLFGRDEYHRGMQIDQYRLPVDLKAGKNTILVKLCQNEQKEEWTKEWEFQLRVCDNTGTAIHAADR
jgi:hypothetical protein